jgi:hypothetical protein
MIRWFALSCVISAAIPAIPAHAADDDEDPRASPPTAEPAPEPPPPPAVEFSTLRHTAIYAVLGFGTPMGFVGFEGVHRFGSTFEVSAGFGRGFLAMASHAHASFEHDVQWAVMPRLRAGNRRHALTLGAGVSGGNTGSGGEWFCDGPCPVRDDPLTYMIWGNVEIGTEHWWNAGFAMRTFVGYARGCTTSSCTSAYAAGQSTPYAGMGFGYAF